MNSPHNASLFGLLLIRVVIIYFQVTAEPSVPGLSFISWNRFMRFLGPLLVAYHFAAVTQVLLRNTCVTLPHFIARV